MAGAIADAGTRADEATIAPHPNGTATLAGHVVFTGERGNFTVAFTGTLGPVGQPREAAEGRWSVVSGTGAYAGTTGEGKFRFTADFTTSDIIGTDDGVLRLADE